MLENVQECCSNWFESVQCAIFRQCKLTDTHESSRASTLEQNWTEPQLESNMFSQSKVGFCIVSSLLSPLRQFVLLFGWAVCTCMSHTQTRKNKKTTLFLPVPLQSGVKTTEHKDWRPFSWCLGEDRSLTSGFGQSTHCNGNANFQLVYFFLPAFLHINM